MKNYASETDDVNPSKIDFLANRVADIVKAEVYEFFQRKNE